MAKAVKKTANSKQQEVATRPRQAVTTGYDMFKNKPTGLENVRPGDILMPRIKILQARNPECLPKHEKYIKGAKEGMFLDTSTQMLFDKLEIVCCHYQIRFIKWSPRKEEGGPGEGFIADLGVDPSVTDGLKYEDYRYLTEDGNHIVDTRTFYALNRVGSKWVPCMFSMTDSQSTPARQWITFMRGIEKEGSDGKPIPMPCYFQSYQCELEHTAKGNWEWVKWNIKPGREVLEIDPSGALLAEAEKFCRLGMKGNLVHAQEERDERVGRDGDGAM